MIRDAFDIACWRFEQISPLLDSSLTSSQRSKIVYSISHTKVMWPSGRESPISRSVLYHWLSLYKANQRIESLIPKERIVKPGIKSIPDEWITYALALLEEMPKRSLFILCVRIQQYFNLKKMPPRSTLHKALQKQPRYISIRRYAKGEHRIRKRFAAKTPHYIWHGDAKAPFTVTFTDSTEKRVRILSLLDDATRAVLAAFIVISESTAAAVKCFRFAAARWGLPEKFYADRGSAYDSTVFRKGLAILGVHRINTKPRNPSAHGKIEAYHRPLDRWFIKELPFQPVKNIAQLQQLLDAFIAKLYNQHVNRELKMSPAQALNDIPSSRHVSLQRLHEAFLHTKFLIPHKKSGDVQLHGMLYKVPQTYLIPRRKLRFAYDIQKPGVAYLLTAGSMVSLKPSVKIVEKNTTISDILPGSLSPLYEKYQGRTIPQAHAGFGLPEIYQILTKTLKRDVPCSENEARMILEWLKQKGPFNPQAFENKLDQVIKRIGTGRPLLTILKTMTNQFNRKDDKK